MRQKPEVLYAVPARRRCLKIAEAVVNRIRTHNRPRRSGALIDSYHARTSGAGAEIYSDLQNPINYWRYIEFGTAKRRGADAQPHVRPAIEEVRAEGVP
jgi:hypothetical protein